MQPCGAVPGGLNNTDRLCIIGNPLTYGEDTTYTWTAGRQLETFENANFKVEYVYNADGLRTRQTIYTKNTETEETQYTLYRVYEYVWKDSVVDSEHILAFGDDGQKTNEVVMKIFYDDNKSPLGFTYTDLVENETQTVWYVKNLQGDITALYMEGIGLVMRISYDAWGKAEYAPGDIEGLEGLSYFLSMLLINPNGYRGYSVDQITGMNYLQSRYYSPVWGRFINVDDVFDSQNILGNNMIAYCLNNPVSFVDFNGKAAARINVCLSASSGFLCERLYLWGFTHRVVNKSYDFSSSWSSLIISRLKQSTSIKIVLNNLISQAQRLRKNSRSQTLKVDFYKYKKNISDVDLLLSIGGGGNLTFYIQKTSKRKNNNIVYTVTCSLKNEVFDFHYWDAKTRHCNNKAVTLINNVGYFTQKYHAFVKFKWNFTVKFEITYRSL